jgi:predicted extracellular nuclease
MNKNAFTILLIFISLILTNNVSAQTEFTMNEVYSRGTTADPDWIEIYNLTNTDFDISGYKIYDENGQSGSSPKKEFPVGSVIPANGFLVIVTDDTSTSGFGLTSIGETVWIENTLDIVVDSVEFPGLQTNESYSRVPNGGSWVITNSITKGSSNIYSNPTTIVINEIYSRGTNENPDWIELYNPSSTQIDISGYKIYDEGGYAGTKPKLVLPTGSIISANGFFVIVTDDTTLTSGFGLSGNGEEVWLEDASGLVLDDVNFPAMDSTQSYIRYPDGTSSWQLTTTITRGFANTITDVENNETLILSFKLEQNYPNPFNPTTTINYSLPFESNVKIIVYNLIGESVKELQNSVQQSGKYSIQFNGSNLPSGIYFYSLTTSSRDGLQTYQSVRKMTLLK